MDNSSEKKLKLAEHAIKAQLESNAALGCQNEILLFENDPGSSESAETNEYFKLMQTEALIAE